MNDKVVLDASVLIAAASRGDTHQSTARRIIRAGATRGVLAAHPVTIAESAVGAARAGRLEALRSIYEQWGLEAITTDDGGPWRAAALRADLGLGLPDAFVLDAAIQHGARLATFDQRLAAAAVASGIQIDTGT